MVFLLHRAKNSHKKTNSMLNRLIIFTFNTGLPVSFCALWACISINVWPTTFIYMFFFLLLYTNSLLVSLNSRDFIKRGNVLTETGTNYVMPSFIDSPEDAELSDLPISRDSKGPQIQGDLGIAVRQTDIQFADTSRIV
ncbi:hypothetical protein F5051DRAFT_413640 [Lentinula edodes]|nr:hypothetical protein F5051DRAFT_413640 [Lentinula edodes]